MHWYFKKFYFWVRWVPYVILKPCSPRTQKLQWAHLPGWWSKCRWLPRRPSPWHCWEWGWSDEVTEPPPGVQTGNPSVETGTCRTKIKQINSCIWFVRIRVSALKSFSLLYLINIYTLSLLLDIRIWFKKHFQSSQVP